MKKNKEIELIKFRRKESRVFTGRPEGKNARKILKLDEIDKNDCIIEIIIPDDTMSVNSSFFLGMFQKSLKDLGEIKFRTKYIFKCKKPHINLNIDKNIKVCLLMLNNDNNEV